MALEVQYRSWSGQKPVRLRLNSIYLSTIEHSVTKNPKQFWHFAKQHLREKEQNICLCDDSGNHFLPAKTANCFANFFCTCYSPVNQCYLWSRRC